MCQQIFDLRKKVLFYQSNISIPHFAPSILEFNDYFIHKNTIIQNIRKTTADTSITTADGLREKILSNMLDGNSATQLTLSYLKTEVTEILG